MGALAAFRNVQGSERKNYIVESIGGGCAFIDYNGDGRLDILLVRGSTLEQMLPGESQKPRPTGNPVVALFENQGGDTFTDVSRKAGLTALGWGMGVVVADYDNDGWSDFVVTGLGRNFLFHNQGDGTFRERARPAGVSREGVWSTGAAFGDLDGDGDLDLFIAAYVDVDLKRLPRRGSGLNCVYKGADVFCGPRGMPAGRCALFRNDGQGKFVDVTVESGIREGAPPFYSLQPLIADFDGDELPDIFVANDSTPNYLFHNQGKLRFQETAITSGVAVNMDGRAQASMGADAADYDNDGALDIFVTNFSEDTNTLYRSAGKGTFEDASWSSRVGPPSWLFLGWGAKFLDYDNDGLLDLVVTNGHVYPEADQFRGGSAYRQRCLLHRNTGNGAFKEIGAREPVLAVPGTGRGLATGDYDNDGDVDVLINNQDSAPRLLRNDAAPAGHWLTVKLQGSSSNRDSVGARVIVRAGKKTLSAVRLSGDSYLSSSDPRLHFGLGGETLVRELAVRWPGGATRKLTNLSVDRMIQIEELKP